MLELVGYKESETRETKFSMIELYESIDAIRGTVLLRYKWPPREVDRLEFQDEDYRGLFFLYNNAITEIASINKEKIAPTK